MKALSCQDENGALFENNLPEIAASDDKLLESLGAPPEGSPQAAVTGGGAFKDSSLQRVSEKCISTMLARAA